MTIDDILNKLMKYCAYQERCPADIRKKVSRFKISEEATQQVIKRLIEENYMDITRYTSAYTRGKFRQNKWGKNKIILGLKQKGIPESYIYQSIDEIPHEEYFETLQKLATQKLKTVAGNSDFEKNQKTAVFLQGKGFELDLIWKVLKE